MSDKIKKAADELMKIADEIDKEAAEVTQFICDKCSHTASLASINSKRQAAAKENEATAAAITINDKIHCPACEGIMAYKATEASEAYYYDSDKKATDDKDKDDKPAEAPDADKEAKKDPDAPHDESKETPAEEKGESLKTQEKERAKGVHASIDYDSLKRYTA